jgi:transposase InsO family protein
MFSLAKRFDPDHNAASANTHAPVGELRRDRPRRIVWTIGTADPLRARAAQLSVLVHEQRSYATAPLWFVARILVHGAGGYQDGQVTIFAAIDHCTAECLGIHVVKKAHRFEALEPIRQAVREQFGSFSAGVAGGLRLRHDHGSVYMSEDFQNELRFLGMESSPAYVRQPEGNGCIERFFRTLKEQMLWLRTFTDLAELREALAAFRHRYNNGWILERLQYRTPSQARRDSGVELCRAA